MGKKPLTVSEVNSRVEELSDEFRKGMSEIKNMFITEQPPASCSSTASSPQNSLLLRIQKFEDDIQQSLIQLKSDVELLKEEATAASNQMRKMELKNNGNYILIHGFAEKEQSNLLDDIIQFICNKFQIEVKKEHFIECYRMGKKHTEKKRPRPVVVLFVHRWLRDFVFFNKKVLKGSKHVITELLTNANFKLYSEARKITGLSAVWTIGGQVYVLCDGNKLLVKSEEELSKIKNSSDDEIF